MLTYIFSFQLNLKIIQKIITETLVSLHLILRNLSTVYCYYFSSATTDVKFA